jgi:hypothetical protein
MRYVVARNYHICSRCLERIGEGDVCVQSESFYGRLFHTYCYKGFCYRISKEAMELMKNDEVINE